MGGGKGSAAPGCSLVLMHPVHSALLLCTSCLSAARGMLLVFALPWGTSSRSTLAGYSCSRAEYVVTGFSKKGGAQEGMQGPFALAEALSMRPTLMPRMDTKQVTARIVRCAERKGPA
eukprot:1146901-Pelagomonas_calceolata.AAC.5